MPNVISTTTPELTDPALRTLGNRVLNTAILSLQKAVAHQVSPQQHPIRDQHSLEQRFLTLLQELPVPRQQAAAAKIASLLNADPAARHSMYGDLAQVDLHSAIDVATQVQSFALPQQLRGLKLSDLRKALQAVTPLQVSSMAPHHPAPGPADPTFNTLSLSIDQIHCDQVTGWFGWEDDDIYVGGVTIDTLGTVTAINPIEVGSFSNGTTRGLSNTFASLAIDEYTNWPKSYSVTIVLAEKHSGGIYDFVYKLADIVKSQVTQMLTTAIGGLIGGIIGSPLPGVGPIVGAIIGAIIGWVVGQVWNWIKDNLFGDDIFVPATMNLTIPFPDALWSGSPNSPQIIWDIQGYGGEYHVYEHWNLAWGSPNINNGWHMYWAGGAWSDWEELGGPLNFDMATASWGPGRLDVFTIGADSALWHLAYDNGWQRWESLGGGLTSGPAAVSWGPNRIDVVARGEDNAVWHICWDGSTWSGWESLGGPTAFRPAACSWGSGRLDIFSFSAGTDQALWHLAFNNGWQPWESLSGGLTSAPAAASWGPNRLDIVGRK